MVRVLKSCALVLVLAALSGALLAYGDSRAPSKDDIVSRSFAPLGVDGSFTNYDVYNPVPVLPPDVSGPGCNTSQCSWYFQLHGVSASSIANMYNVEGIPWPNPSKTDVVGTDASRVTYGPLPNCSQSMTPGAPPMHFGYELTSGIVPTTVTGMWSNVSSATCNIGSATLLNWVAPNIPALAGGARAAFGAARPADAESVIATIVNVVTSTVMISRSAKVVIANPVDLDNLRSGTPLTAGATVVDGSPIPLAAGESVAYQFAPGPSAVAVLLYYTVQTEAGVKLYTAYHMISFAGETHLPTVTPAPTATPRPPIWLPYGVRLWPAPLPTP